MTGCHVRFLGGGEGVREDSFLPDLSRKIAYLSSLRVNNKTDYFYEILCDLLNIKRITKNINKTLRIYRFLGFYLC